MQKNINFFSFGCPNVRWGGGGSTWLGQNPKFSQKNHLKAPLTANVNNGMVLSRDLWTIWLTSTESDATTVSRDLRIDNSISARFSGTTSPFTCISVYSFYSCFSCYSCCLLDVIFVVNAVVVIFAVLILWLLLLLSNWLVKGDRKKGRATVILAKLILGLYWVLEYWRMALTHIRSPNIEEWSPWTGRSSPKFGRAPRPNTFAALRATGPAIAIYNGLQWHNNFEDIGHF